MEASFVTILFCDLVGSTHMLDRLGDEAADAIRRAHFAALRAAVHDHHGREIKSTDDGLMVSFTSAIAAVRCAIAMQRASNQQPEWLPLRVGIDGGEPVADGDDFSGTRVNVASRLCDAAKRDDILISDVVARIAGLRITSSVQPIGPLALAGFSNPISAQSVRWRSLSSDLRVALLGPLTVTRSGEPVPISSPRQRSILALLALDAGRVVSVDRLVDSLWSEGSRPEDAPAALQTQLSRLRAALGEGVIATRAPGYVLDVEPTQVDVYLARANAAEAKRLIGECNGSDARRLAAEALDLWRGVALADIADAPFAAAVQVTTEEERLAVRETLAEARLELGEHAEVISELRDLVRHDPYRESSWRLLMLALYRAGRQAEALDAFADVRRTLAADLGLEPGPALRESQRQILAHDVALGPPQPARPTAPPPQPESAPLAAPASRALGPPRPPVRALRPRRRLITGAAMTLFAATAVVAALVVRGSDRRPVHTPSAAGGGVVLQLDAVTGALRHRIAVGRSPGPIAVGAGATWEADLDAQTITKIRSSRAVSTFALGYPLIDLAAGRELFVGTGSPAAGTQISGPIVAAVQRVAPALGTVRARTPLPTGATVQLPPEQQLALVGKDVWSIAADGTVVRIHDDFVDGRVRGIVATAIAAGPAGLWVAEDDGTVARIDPRRPGVAAHTHLAATSLAGLAVGTDNVWASSPSDGSVWRIPATNPKNAQAIALQPGVAALVVAGDAIWAADPLNGTVTRVDGATGQVTKTVSVGGEPSSLAADGSSVWVAVDASSATTGTSRATNTELSSAPCEPAYGQAGVRPDVLLASDLPLQGGIRVSTTNMTAAIALELRARDFRAGRYHVAYVSCDDSIARTGLFDPARCAANARAYVAAPHVLGVVGALNSPCTAAALTALDTAGARAPALVSPLSSDPSLTRSGASPSFSRVFPTDDLQGAGLALLAEQLGARRVFVLDDGDPGYGVTLSNAFTRAAERLGVRIVGSDSWNPASPHATRPIAAAVAANPDAVVLSGTLDDGGTTVLRALHRALRSHAKLLLGSGFTPTAILAHDAGRAAEGAYIAVTGATLDALTTTGRAFGHQLATVESGAETDPASYYAAQAAAVLLDAIARSNGTRESVRRAVRATHLRDGMFGPVAFDSHGDILKPAISILRVRVGDHARQDFPDTKVDRVIYPSRTLLAP